MIIFNVYFAFLLCFTKKDEIRICKKHDLVSLVVKGKVAVGFCDRVL